MQPIKSFRTKTGFCHILPEKILLTREGIIGNTAHVVAGKSIARLLIIYSLMAVGFFYFAYYSFINEDKIVALFFTMLGIWLAYGVISSLNNSATPIINRVDIQKVIFKKAIPSLTRARFEVFFRENGRLKKRLIMLPGSISGGPNETAKAIEIMASENLMSQ